MAELFIHHHAYRDDKKASREGFHLEVRGAERVLEVMKQGPLFLMLYDDCVQVRGVYGGGLEDMAEDREAGRKSHSQDHGFKCGGPETLTRRFGLLGRRGGGLWIIPPGCGSHSFLDPSGQRLFQSPGPGHHDPVFGRHACAGVFGRQDQGPWVNSIDPREIPQPVER